MAEIDRSVGPSGEIHYATKFFTGIRPTGELTVANLMAVQPLIELQRKGPTTVFVADMHAATTHSIEDSKRYSRTVVKDYIAMGLDPEGADIFVQSALYPEIAMLTQALSRHVTISELMRQPTLKEKVRDTDTAPTSLVMYPVMMAADILSQDAQFVPVGADQLPHIELTRDIADRINGRHGTVLVKPAAYQKETPPRYLSLRGEGKMSKSNPEGALLLTDTDDVVRRKIKRAVTASPGESSPHLKSHIALARRLTTDPEAAAELDRIYAEHMSGDKVMGAFKQTFTDIVLDFYSSYHNRRAQISNEKLEGILTHGASNAKVKAKNVIERMKSAGAMF